VREWHQLTLNTGDILDLSADYDRELMYLKIVNRVDKLGGLAFALNANALGISVSANPAFPEALEFGEIAEVAVPITVDPAKVGNVGQDRLQIALRTSRGDIFAVDSIPGHIATVPEGRISQDEFRQCFQDCAHKTSVTVGDATVANEQRMNAGNVFVVGKNGPKTFVSFAFLNKEVFVAELTQEGESIVVNVIGPSPQLFAVIKDSARALFAEK